MFANLTGVHAVVILVLVLFLFGAAKLPALAKSLGQSIKIFKDETAEYKTAEYKTVENKPLETKTAQNTTAQNTTAEDTFDVAEVAVTREIQQPYRQAS